MNYVVPCIILFVLLLGLFKKVNVYQTFTDGVKEALPLVADIFPYVASVLVMVGLLRASGVPAYLQKVFSPVFIALGVPTELTELVLLRPFSGSGSLALLQNVLEKYGTDSFLGRCACTICGSGETVFYVSAVYFAGTNVKKLGWAMVIALFCSLTGVVLSCIFCRIM